MINYTHSFKTGRQYDTTQVIEYVEAENKGGQLFNEMVYQCRDESRNMRFQVEVMIFDLDDRQEIEDSILEAYDNGNYSNI
ncbi:hypothetical protein [Vibrio harveyi]|uniref:hypothetical protein n=1 Tax=Vibrio harveyi TaxID=669 RepID=UPI003D753AF5